MREEKDKLMASLQSVEEAREMDKQNHAKDKEILCDELNIEKVVNFLKAIYRDINKCN